MNAEPYSALDFFRNAFVLIPQSENDQYKTILIPGVGRKKHRLFCTCSRGKTPTCAHVERLVSLHDAFMNSMQETEPSQLFEKSFFRKLFAVFSRVYPLPLGRCAVETLQESDLQFNVQSNNRTVLTWCHPGTSADRFSGRIMLREPFSRAWLLNQSKGLVENEFERMMRGNDTLTVRQREEGCFWYQAAYHCFREYTPEMLKWELTVDNTGTVVLHTLAGAKKLFFLQVPSKAVPGIIAVLQKAGYASSQWYYLKKETELYFDVHEKEPDTIQFIPVVVLPGGKAFRIHKHYCYDTLGYLPDIDRFVRFSYESLQRLATGWEEAKTVAQKDLSAFLETNTDALSVGIRSETDTGVMQGDLFGNAENDDFGRLLNVTLITSFDNIELLPQSVEKDTWVILIRFRSGDNVIMLSELTQAKSRRDRYLLSGGCLVDLKSDGVASALTQARGIRKDGAVKLSNVSLLMLRGSSKTLHLEGNEGLTSRIRRLFDFRPEEELKIPVGLRGTLREYQFNGVAWLMFLFDNHLGGLLCDDMGLGKTIQLITLMLAVKEQREVNATFLVVCPTSVISHWCRLIERFAPDLKVFDYHDGTRQFPDKGTFDVLVTSYGILRNDLAMLRQFCFDIIVCDEIQHCKNSLTLAHKAVSGLAGRMKIGLTGTPVENSVDELKALFDLVTPGLLDELPPEEQFLNTLENEKESSALRQFKNRIEPFILRRLKASVLTELPEKIEEERICRLSSQQYTIYSEALEKRGGPLIASLKNSETPVPYMHIYALLTFLKQVCDTTALAAGRWDEYEMHESGKFELFKELLDESLGSGQKVVVFTQFLGMVDIFNHYLNANGIASVSLTGKTRNRKEVLRRFAEDDDCRVFVGSLRAGGVGIDLISASVVIHYDRWWNAAREDQATDRVYRMGQTRGVQVFKLVTENTIEERISRIIERKRELTEATLSEDDPDSIKRFSREELVELLSM